MKHPRWGRQFRAGFLSTLGLLELVGQVEPSERLSEDTLLVEGIRSWKVELEHESSPCQTGSHVSYRRAFGV